MIRSGSLAEQEGDAEGAVQPRQDRGDGLLRARRRVSISRATRWATTSLSVSTRKLRPSASISSRSGLKFSMMPLWTSATVAGDVRMGVADGRRAVGRPAGVGDADLAVQRLAGQLALQIVELALGPAALEARRRRRCDAGAVIAAIFEPPEPVEQPLRDGFPCR